MGKSLLSKAIIQFNGFYTNTDENRIKQDSDDISFAKYLSNGTGLDQADSFWSDRRTLSANTTEDIDLYDFAGIVDAYGDPLTLTKICGIILRNRETTAGLNLLVGGKGTGAAWNSLFNGDDDALIVVGPGGLFCAFNPSLAAYDVADSTNHLLKINNTSLTNSVTYDIMVIGRD